MTDASPFEPSEWSRLDELFHAALAHPAESRAAFIARSCSDAPALAQRLQRMLDHADSDALESAIVPDGSAPEGEAGQLCGPYRLVEAIGRGGMGTVWRAERDDDAFDEQVAVKLLSGVALNEVSRRRFGRERQFLAQLRHPHVASLLDGGTTETGRPFLVMECIDGLRIDEHCAALELSIRDRVELFLDVCRAVEHAHQKLVIHRDLKPSNILVTSAGVVKLLDFGVASVLDDTESSEGNEARSRPLTPRYSSPEQLGGAPLSTATDVYALGVVLYELLTLNSPYEGSTAHLASLVRAVCDEEIVPPSQSNVGQPKTRSPLLPPTDHERWRRTLRGDLDAIVLCCLEKSPADRYASVERLANDLQQWLAGREVSVRRWGRIEHTLRWTRQHRVASMAVTLGGSGLVIGLAMAWMQAGAARTAWSEERTQRTLAEERLIDVGHLNRRLRAEQAETEHQKTAALRRSSDLQEFASSTIFDLVQASSGTAPTELLVRLIQMGLDALERLRNDASTDPDYLRTLAVSYTQLGLQLGSAGLHSLGQGERAEQALVLGVSLARRAHALRPTQPETRYALARTLLALGGHRASQMRWSDALEIYREGARVIEPIARPTDRSGFRHIALLNSRALAKLLYEIGRVDEADDCMKIYERRAHEWQAREGGWIGQLEMAQWHELRSSAATARGAPASELVDIWSSAVDAAREAVRLRPEAADVQRALERTESGWLFALIAADRLDEAADALDAMRGRVETLLESHPNSLGVKLDAANSWRLTALLEQRRDAPLEAEEAWARCLSYAAAALENHDAPDSRARFLQLDALRHRAKLFRTEGFFEESEDELDAFGDLWDSSRTGHSFSTVRREWWVERALLARDRAAESTDRGRRESWLREALEHLDRALAPPTGEIPAPDEQRKRLLRLRDDVLSELDGR